MALKLTGQPAEEKKVKVPPRTPAEVKSDNASKISKFMTEKKGEQTGGRKADHMDYVYGELRMFYNSILPMEISGRFGEMIEVEELKVLP